VAFNGCTFNKKLDFVSNNFCHSGIVVLTVELKGTQPFIPFLLLLRRLEQKKLFDTKTSKDESHCLIQALLDLTLKEQLIFAISLRSFKSNSDHF
jgi:hypothetical protein